MIYLDSAATTFQKPPEVAAAMAEALETMSSPGRGGHPLAMHAADAAFDCRCEIAELFHAESPEQVIFTCNATHGLNIAIKTLVPQGGRVVISGYEHNAVTRPLAALHARVSVADAPLFAPEQVAEAFDALIQPGMDAVICSHVSNVFGFAQPVEQVAAICRARGVPLIIDAAQSAGMLPLDLTQTGAAFIAMPGHKGLYGPQGTGVLLCGTDVKVKTLIEGGTGSDSLKQDMPDYLPDRLEPGTHNMPGIAGLLAGVRYVRRRGAAILRQEQALCRMAVEELRNIPDLQIFAEKTPHAQTGVISLRHRIIDVETLGSELARRNVAVRSGLHCAPLAHRTAGTLDTGTVRVSFSDFNTEAEVRQFARIMAQISS